MMDGLRVLGVDFFPSHANFVLMKIGAKHAELVRAMRARGVLLRDRSTDPGCDGFVRITIGVEEHVTRGLAALKESLQEIGWAQMSDEKRTGTIKRDTTETKIALTLTIDGQGTYSVSTGIRFFDHMLELFTRHGGFDLTLACKGDLDVDQHHTVEDVGIALGEAFAIALGDKKGILRAGYFVMTMDETLAVAAVDLSGRASYVVDDQVTVPLVGDFQSELLTDFFEGFARGAKANVHVKIMYGRSNHHKIEASSKPSRERCAAHAAAMNVCASCCQAQRGCCDCSH